MEATGCYHQQLALFLYDKAIRVTVMNPLVIKRFIQMKLNRVKTDKSDAKMIYHYGQEQQMDLWSPSPQYVEDCKQLQTITQLYFKQSTAIKNKLHALQTRGFNKGKMIRSLKHQLKNLQKEIKLLESEMEQLLNLISKTFMPDLIPCQE
jgi:transposase